MLKVTLYLGRGGLILKQALRVCLMIGCWPMGPSPTPTWSLEIADLVKLMVLYLAPPSNNLRKYFTNIGTEQV